MTPRINEFGDPNPQRLKGVSRVLPLVERALQQVKELVIAANRFSAVLDKNSKFSRFSARINKDSVQILDKIRPIAGLVKEAEAGKESAGYKARGLWEDVVESLIFKAQETMDQIEDTLYDNPDPAIKVGLRSLSSLYSKLEKIPLSGQLQALSLQ